MKKSKNIWLYIKNYRADSLFFRNLILILVMFLVPYIIISGIYYKNVENMAKDKIELENSLTIHEVRDVIDTVISEFDSICSYAANDSSVQMFMLNDWYVNFDDGESADLFRTINMSKYVYSYVDSIYIYSEYNDAVISENKMTSSREFDDMGWADDYRSINDKRGITVARNKSGVFPYVISIIKPIYVDSDKRGAVIFNIDSSKLYRSVANVEYGNEQNLFLINSDGNIILTRENEYFAKPVNSIDYLSDVEPNTLGFTRRVDGKPCMISSVQSEKFDFYYINVSPDVAYAKRLRQMRSQILMFILLILLFSIILSYIVALKNYQPVVDIISVLDNPENYDVSGSANRFNELRYISKSIIEKSHENEVIQKELEDKLKKLKEAQMNMLQLQINPHFLYNSLETINWMAVGLTKSRNDVSKAIADLAKFYRINSSEGDYLIPIKEEVERTVYYLNIIRLRYGDMFEIKWDINDDIMEYLIVKICLQPIIENAVYHGLKPKGEHGLLEVKGRKSDDEIIFEVCDNGVGMSESKLKQLNEHLDDIEYTGSSHIGLYNINKRLKIVFGEKYGIKVYSKEGEGTQVVVRIPADKM